MSSLMTPIALKFPNDLWAVIQYARERHLCVRTFTQRWRFWAALFIICNRSVVGSLIPQPFAVSKDSIHWFGSRLSLQITTLTRGINHTCRCIIRMYKTLFQPSFQRVSCYCTWYYITAFSVLTGWPIVFEGCRQMAYIHLLTLTYGDSARFRVQDCIFFLAFQGIFRGRRPRWV